MSLKYGIKDPPYFVYKGVVDFSSLLADISVDIEIRKRSVGFDTGSRGR